MGSWYQIKFVIFDETHQVVIDWLNIGWLGGRASFGAVCDGWAYVDFISLLCIAFHMNSLLVLYVIMNWATTREQIELNCFHVLINILQNFTKHCTYTEFFCVCISYSDTFVMETVWDIYIIKWKSNSY